MSTYNAEQKFKSAIEHISPSEDPAMWNLLSGLIELCGSLSQIESELRLLSSDVRNIKGR